MSRYDDVISDFCSVLPQTDAAHADESLRAGGCLVQLFGVQCMSTALPARSLPPIKTNTLVRMGGSPHAARAVDMHTK